MTTISCSTDSLINSKNLSSVIWTILENSRSGLTGNITELSAIIRNIGVINDEIIKTFSIGWAPNHYDDLYNKLKTKYSDEVLEKAGLILKSNKGSWIDRFRNRIIIPIQNENGDVVAFGARAVEEGQNPKYLNSSDSIIYNKSKLLYGLYTAKDAIKEQDGVVLMEGYFDVISAQAHGIENCVGVCGTSLTQDHIKLLSRYTKSRKIYLNFDTDNAGQKATNRGAEIIKEVFGGMNNIKAFDESYISTSDNKYACEVRVISPPEGKDPDEFIRTVGAESYKKYIQNAPLLIDYQINHILKDKNKYKTPTEKAHFIKTIIPILKEIGNKIIRAEYTEMVAQALNIDSKILTKEINSSYVTSNTITENIVKNVTKKTTILQKAQKNLLSLYLVNVKPLNFQEITHAPIMWALL